MIDRVAVDLFIYFGGVVSDI